MIPIEFEPPVEDARVVIGIDFGTTFSGFSFAYIKSEKEKIAIVVNDNWQGIKGPMKTNTVLQYDEDYEDVIAWGAKALASEPTKKAKNNQPKPVELFKLHLGDVPESKKPKLPNGITPERAITDYLREMGKAIKDEIKRCWSDIDFYRHVRIIVTVPAGFPEKTKTIMRKYLFDAGLIKRIGTLSLQFTTEPEAAAIHCMSILKEHGLSTGAKYLIVDCGGGTVDLTVRKLLPDNKLGETTMTSDGFHGGTYVDDKFLEFLEKKVGKSAMDELKEKNYGQISYMVQHFCFHVKIPFTGEESDFKTFEWDIERKCPALKKYVTGSEKSKLREDDWIIDLDFKTVKGFFDPVIDKILKLIEDQLDRCSDCSVIFLVGGFSESKYLQTRVKQTFGHKIKVAVPPRPVIAVVSGACEYGLDTKAVSTRVLKWTYGVQISPEWKPGDPTSRKTSKGRIDKFCLMASKEVQVDVDKEFSKRLYPIYPNQTSITFPIYYTSKYNATYCDEPEMNFLGEFEVDLPDVHLGKDRPVMLTLRFGSMEIFVKATNETNGKVYRTTFCSAE